MSIKATIITVSLSLTACFTSAGYLASAINAEPVRANVQSSGGYETHNWYHAKQFRKRRVDARRTGLDKTGLDALFARTSGGSR